MDLKRVLLRFVILIILISLVLIGIYAIITSSLHTLLPKESEPTPLVLNESRTPPVLTELFFNKDSIVVNQATVSATVMIDTHGQTIRNIQVELYYNPMLISNIKMSTPAGAFLPPDSQVLLKNINTKNGRITYAARLASQKAGAGPLIILDLTIPQPLQSLSQIQFLDKSIITVDNSHASVLAKTKPLILKPQMLIFK